MKYDNDNDIPRSREDARKMGVNRYFTGEPCAHGHVAERDTKGGVCQECNRERARKWSASYPDKKRERDFKRYWSIPEERRESARKYASEHREEARQRANRWRKENPERESANARTKRARKRGARGSHTAGDIARLLKQQRYRCAYCSTSIKKKTNRHVDHIMPLKLGGSNDKSNLQMLCPPCNLSKKAAHPLDYARRIGLLC